MSKQTDPFYRTKAWQKARYERLSKDNYLCQRCLKQKRITTADMVHHIKPLKDYPELALVIGNLISLCNTCHEKEHHRRVKKHKAAVTRRAKVIVCKANEIVI